MREKGSGGKSLKEREAALIAAARRELGQTTAPKAGDAATPTATVVKTAPRANSAAISVKAIPVATPAVPPAVKPPSAAAAIAPLLPPASAPKPDIATRMAMPMEAEKLANEERKRRIKRNYMIAIAAVLVPAFLYVIVNLLKILVR